MKKTRFSLFTKLAILTGVLSFISILMAESYFRNHERAVLELALREKITFITNYYAIGVADALSRNDDILLQQIINGMEQDHDIVAVTVVDGENEIRYHADAEKVGTHLEDPLVKKSLDSGEGIATPVKNAGGKALELVIPLKARGKEKPEGAIRLDITYAHIEDQVKSGPASFEMMAMGLISSCIGGILWGFKKWVLSPLNQLRGAVARINPALLEANLPESTDEFGEVNRSLNELLMRLRTEWGVQKEMNVMQADDERVLIEQLGRSLMPEVRMLLVDRENRVVADTRKEAVDPKNAPHLLDLVNDADFSTLINTAMQNEGIASQGRVQFESIPYEATIVRLPQGQSKLIRMVIALRPSTDMDNKKETV